MRKSSGKEASRRLFDIESPMAIELRRIMIRLSRDIDLQRKRILMVTSAEQGEGKSLFALHFSMVLAYHLRKKILLIDGDVRRPVQHTVFQVPRSPGFAELLADNGADHSIAPHSSKIENLFFLPAGTAGDHPSRLFSGERLPGLLGDLQQQYDIIILDAPPVVPVSDPLHFAEAVDGVIFLLMAGRTSRDIALRGIEILRGVGAKIVGVIANNLVEVLPYYYDQKYYGYRPDGKRKKKS